MLVVQGTTATFGANFLRENGDPLTVTSVAAVIYDSVGAAVSPATTITQIDADSYEATWVAPSTLPIGLYRVHWTAMSGLVLIEGSEWFEVVTPGSVSTSEIGTLRSLVGDRLGTGMVAADLFFTDSELHSIWLRNDMDMNAAAWEGWKIKSGFAADLVDMRESGAERKLSQRFANYLSMADFFKARVSEDRALRSAGIGRVAGKALSLRNDPTDIFGLYTVAGYIGINGNEPTYIRTYALKRFMPAIL